MLFVEDQHAAARWWAAAFAVKNVEVLEDRQGAFVWFETAAVEIGFHVADPERNPRGGSTVVYWSVRSVDAARERLLELGARPHRGPLAIDPRRSICQLSDPFGNIFGLDGPP
jgi:predicted enzyme related to lactoylglutathione lyase